MVIAVKYQQENNPHLISRRFCSFQGIIDEGNIESIQYLDCIDNQLTSLPEWISQLINLRHLGCSHNQLTSLPNLEKLIHLECLCCSYNQLTSLPDYINQFVNLKEFICSGNCLTTIPSWLLALQVEENPTIPDNLETKGCQPFHL